MRDLGAVTTTHYDGSPQRAMTVRRALNRAGAPVFVATFDYFDLALPDIATLSAMIFAISASACAPYCANTSVW